MPRTTTVTVAREPKYVRLAEIVDHMPKDSSVRQIQAAFSEKYQGERVASSYVSLVRGGLGRNGRDDRQPRRGRRPNVPDCVYADDVRRVAQMAADCGGATSLEKILAGIEVCGGIRGVRRVLKMGKTMR